MRRRAFIAGLGGVAAWPVVARAQQATTPVGGFMSARSLENTVEELKAFTADWNRAALSTVRTSIRCTSCKLSEASIR